MKNEPIEEREPQGDGPFKVRVGNNREKIIQIWCNCSGMYTREYSADCETITYTKTFDGNEDGWPVRRGMHTEKIVNAPSIAYGWYRRFTENEGDIIHFQKV